MPRRKHNISKKELKKVLEEQEDFLKVLVEKVMQEVLEAEMDEALGASKGERTPGRVGYRSGHYTRGLVSRVGKIELMVPQDRDGRVFRLLPAWVVCATLEQMGYWGLILGNQGFAIV